MPFADLYGGRAAGAWAAPGRVNLIGEHTDYNDGYVLPFALPLRVVVEASAIECPEWTVWSAKQGGPVTFGLDDLEPGRVTGWAAYPAGVVWALRAAGHEPPGAMMAITSDLPDGAGLSSSAALECAVLAALVDLGGLDLPLGARPPLAQRAENDYVGMPCGIMDQSAATLCEPGNALYLDCRTLRADQIPFDVAAHGLAVLVTDTRAPHQHVTGEYAVRRLTCEQAAAALGVTALRDIADVAALAKLTDDVQRRRARHVITENQRVLDTVDQLRAGELREIGPLMTASHLSLRDDFEVTVPQLDVAVQAALAAGAYGARMTGGGFGGCVLSLVEASQADTTAAVIAKAFGERGFDAPESFVALPSPGASRVA